LSGALLYAGQAAADYSPNCQRHVPPGNAPRPPQPLQALIIGNEAYKKRPALQTPASDADSIGAALAAIGFEVHVCKNLNSSEMIQAIFEYKNHLSPNAISLFYYAGHGAISSNRSVLFGVENNPAVDPRSQITVDLENHVVFPLEPSQGFQDTNEPSPVTLKASLFIIDACRTSSRGDTPQGGGDVMNPVQAPMGSYIVYSTAPSRPAWDAYTESEPGPGLDPKRHSPFAAKLLMELRQLKSGTDVDTLFRHVRTKVKEVTRDQQIPWTSHSLVGEVLLKS